MVISMFSNIWSLKVLQVFTYAEISADNSKGGDVNITDDDNETPLYTVETVAVARWLVDHGAKMDWINTEEVTV
jgi:hypothetical protein